MYSVQIHSVDDPRPLSTGVTTTTATSTAKPAVILERRGVAHLFRSSPSPFATSLASPSARTTTLIVVAVPNYLSPDDFLLFCGIHLDSFSAVVFLRNDGMEDRYSVLIELVNQLSADGFYCDFNGKRFSPSETEICHIYFTPPAVYSEYDEEAGMPPDGFVELPTCPVCLERLDQDTSGIQTTLCDHSFQCPCVSKWTNLSCQVCRLCHQQQDEKPTCADCGTLKNLWLCVICGFVGCGRYEERHAFKHWKDTKHCYSLDLETQQVWDYVGDCYVHRLNQSKDDCKSAVTNSDCMTHHGECGTCGYSEDSGISEALFNSKVEATVNEYNHLLATQLETQRQHYELLLVEAKSKKESCISEAVESALSSNMQDNHSKLEKTLREKKAVADTNQDLMKEQEMLQNELKEIEEREISSLRSRDEKIQDLEEQIRDLRIYLEAQKTLAGAADEDGIRGGTLLPVQSSHSPANNHKRRTRSSRKRN